MVLVFAMFLTFYDLSLIGLAIFVISLFLGYGLYWVALPF
jgi:hypothetical protein